MDTTTLRLNNGVECPAVGIGTFMLSPADAENSVREALKMGYRLVDTVSCNDGLRPVIMKLEATDEESKNRLPANRKVINRVLREFLCKPKGH